MTARRLLYVGFDVGYINPTRQLLVRALAETGDLLCFGPGFSSQEDLRRGVDAFYAQHGPFFAVISDEYVLQEMDGENPQGTRFVNHACRFDRSLLIKALEFRRFLQDVDCRRVLTLMQIDYYNLRESFLDRLAALSDYFVGWGPELMPSRDAFDGDARRLAGLTEVDREVVANWTDRYRDFLLAHPERAISLPHLLAEEELCNRPLSRRRHPWTVVGAEYTERSAARRALDGAGLARTGRRLPHTTAAFQRMGINPHAHYWSIALLQRLFRDSLKTARYGYTCGSVAGMAIRKYFEIPAAGAVLVADKCQGFDALGFRNRENAVLSRGSEVMEAHRWLSGLKDKGQAVADAGRALVEAQHTVKARGRQLAAAIAAIAEGQFAGSRWADGRFHLMAPDGSETAV